MNEEEPEGKDDDYAKERAVLDKGEFNASESFDKYLITLTSGALGFSVLYLEKVIKSPRPGSYWLLIWSWIFFGLCLCGILTSFLSSQHGWRRLRDLLDESQCKKLGQGVRQKPPGLFFQWARGRIKSGQRLKPVADRCEQLLFLWVDRENPWGSVTMWLNIYCLIFFVVGVAIFLVFCGCNLP